MTSLSLFKEAVQNVAEESTKSNYNPETDTNWCHLPMEIRMKCIGEMDFKSRTSLQCTSNTEKCLVKSKKYRLTKIIFYFYEHYTTIVHTDRRDSFNLAIPTEKRLNAVLTVLKTCEIDNLELFNEDSVKLDDHELNELARLPQFRIREFTISSHDSRAVRFFLKRCANLERITFGRSGAYSTYKNVPTVRNIKQLYFTNIRSPKTLLVVVQRWLEDNATIGKSLEFFTTKQNVLMQVSSEFSSRIVSQTEQQLVIRMKNKTRRIVVTTHGLKVDCRVISVSSLESGNG